VEQVENSKGDQWKTAMGPQGSKENGNYPGGDVVGLLTLRGRGGGGVIIV